MRFNISSIYVWDNVMPEVYTYIRSNCICCTTCSGPGLGPAESFVISLSRCREEVSVGETTENRDSHRRRLQNASSSSDVSRVWDAEGARKGQVHDGQVEAVRPGAESTQEGGADRKWSQELTGSEVTCPKESRGQKNSTQHAFSPLLPVQRCPCEVLC